MNLIRITVHRQEGFSDPRILSISNRLRESVKQQYAPLMNFAVEKNKIFKSWNSRFMRY